MPIELRDVLLMCIAIVTSLILKTVFGPSGQVPLVPGPKQLPVIGNLIPSTYQWLKFSQWAKLHGATKNSMLQLKYVSLSYGYRRYLLAQRIRATYSSSKLPENCA